MHLKIVINIALLLSLFGCAMLPSPSKVSVGSRDEPLLRACKNAGNTQNADFACVDILFGTNREQLADGATADLSNYFGGVFGPQPDLECEPNTANRAPDWVCHVGLAIVTIPRPQKRRNNFGTPFDSFAYKGQPSPRDRNSKFTIWGVEVFPSASAAERFRNYTQRALGRLDPSKKHAII